MANHTKPNVVKTLALAKEMGTKITAYSLCTAYNEAVKKNRYIKDKESAYVDWHEFSMILDHAQREGLFHRRGIDNTGMVIYEWAG